MYSGMVSLLDVSDMDRSVDFYVNNLGFEMTRSWAPEGKILWCKLDLGEAQLMLQQSDCDGLGGRGVTFYAIVSNIDEYHKMIRANGVKATDIEEAFYGMRQSYVRDPDGYSLCFGVFLEAD